MIISNENILKLSNLINKIMSQEIDNIYIKYKFLKLNNLIKEDVNLINQSISDLVQKYAEKENGKPIVTEQGIKIQESYTKEVETQMKSIYSQTVTIPDFLFSLEELSDLKLSWSELETLFNFIKN